MLHIGSSITLECSWRKNDVFWLNVVRTAVSVSDDCSVGQVAVGDVGGRGDLAGGQRESHDFGPQRIQEQGRDVFSSGFFSFTGEAEERAEVIVNSVPTDVLNEIH